jgi:hypothetical protein
MTPPTEHSGIPGQAPDVVSLVRHPAVMTAFAAILVLCQVLDGFATGLGMARFGVAMEGNIALREAMRIFGVAPTLIIAKGLAIAIVISLRLLGRQVTWVGETLALLSLAYIGAAIIPWSVILLK